MTISYNWLSEYLPEKIEPQELSAILTSIGLEVETIEKFETIKGGLKGLLVGEVLACEKHPDADKLKLTKVNIGQEKSLSIVCGAPNVAIGQKVIVAPVGTTIFPLNGDPLTMKKARIRGIESEGMICAEDEIGLGESHDGIKILSEDCIPGTLVADIFKSYEDIIFEIGLTPNRMDAMSHLGVAKDVCAYLTYHHKNKKNVRSPYKAISIKEGKSNDVKVEIKNKEACYRYSGLTIKGIKVGESPDWLKQRLLSIGQKPINNVVDVSNFILHETGQPIHIFDLSKIKGKQIIVTNALEGQHFVTLDGKERKLSATDLVISNEQEPMCLAGVYGGLNSGVTDNTYDIFIETACFDKKNIRKTALHHDLRTESANRFEKGVDIGNTLNVLCRAALLIEEIAGGVIENQIIDVYPRPKEKTIIDFNLNFLKKLSGKSYAADSVKDILNALDFEIVSEKENDLRLAVPLCKSDIHIQADIVEEIMRIDGLDNVEIPETINFATATAPFNKHFVLKEKMAQTFIGWGFFEIFTNSITNSGFFKNEELAHSVKMINSLSTELDMMRPKMLQTGLQVISHNLNRKNNDLKLFEFGKTYQKNEKGFSEKQHLAIYVSGMIQENHWQSASKPVDFYFLKGVVSTLLLLGGVSKLSFKSIEDESFSNGCEILSGKTVLGKMGEIATAVLKTFDIKSRVFFADLELDTLIAHSNQSIRYKEISKFPSVSRDLAFVVDKNVSYSEIERIALSLNIEQLVDLKLFDIFESEKLGTDKKSLAVNFIFLDETKTMTDQEIDNCMQQIIEAVQKKINAEIRK